MKEGNYPNEMGKQCPYCHKNIDDSLFDEHLHNHKEENNELNKNLPPLSMNNYLPPSVSSNESPPQLISSDPRIPNIYGPIPLNDYKYFNFPPPIAYPPSYLTQNNNDNNDEQKNNPMHNNNEGNLNNPIHNNNEGNLNNPIHNNNGYNPMNNNNGYNPMNNNGYNPMINNNGYNPMINNNGFNPMINNNGFNPMNNNNGNNPMNNNNGFFPYLFFNPNIGNGNQNNFPNCFDPRMAQLFHPLRNINPHSVMMGVTPEIIESFKRAWLAMSDEEIEQVMECLPIKTLTEKKEGVNTNCIICLTDYEVGDTITTLPCFHMFHSNCVKDWFKSQNSCPICKYEISMKKLRENSL